MSGGELPDSEWEARGMLTSSAMSFIILYKTLEGVNSITLLKQKLTVPCGNANREGNCKA